MKTLFLLFLLLQSSLLSASEMHTALTKLLSVYTHDSRVNYPGICQDQRFIDFVAKLDGMDPETIQDQQDRLAFWINAYNASTIKVVCDHYPIHSLNDLRVGSTSVWDQQRITLGNRKWTLNEIENQIIRKQFHEPRIHFALVCASRSCPALRNEAYEGNRLDEQLSSQARIFLTDSFKNRFDVSTRSANISRIFDWYSADFGTQKEVLLFLTAFLPASIRQDIENHANEWKISYLPYDWSLNE